MIQMCDSALQIPHREIRDLTVDFFSHRIGFWHDDKHLLCVEPPTPATQKVIIPDQKSHHFPPDSSQN
jgi:hypothetical protein